MHSIKKTYRLEEICFVTNTNRKLVTLQGKIESTTHEGIDQIHLFS